jgi:hypothetical protein
MSPAPTPQTSDPSTWFDDPNIENADQLYRVCKTFVQVGRTDDGEFYLSEKIFSALHGGVSVEIASLVAAAGQTPQDRFNAHANAMAMVAVGVGVVRATQKKDGRGTVLENQKVAFTPQDANVPGGPNPFHADIFPAPSNSGNEKLTEESATVVEIDQARASEYWQAKHGHKL